MKAIVISERHALLPFAWRLKREGNEVQTIAMKDRYEKAWDGLLPKTLSGKAKNKEGWQALAESTDSKTLVITDSAKAVSFFEGSEAQVLGPGPSRSFTDIPAIFLVGWFDGEATQGLAYLIPDWGAHQGGMGRMVLGGGTLYIPRESHLLSLVPTEELKSASYRGLVMVGLRLNTVSKELESVGYLTGWPFLATHLYLSDQPSVGDLSLGKTVPKFDKQFTVGGIVSVPPWPVESNHSARATKVAGLLDQDMASIFFHDMKVTDDEEVWVAGLDGLVAVVRGTADILTYARSKVLAICQRFRLPEIQYRQDLGVRVDSVLVGLEETGLL